jgi:hypothetical protein
MISSDENWEVDEIREVLKPLYDMTMRTHGWDSANGHCRLFEVMLVMEWILVDLESWKSLQLRGNQPSRLSFPTLSATKPSRT